MANKYYYLIASLAYLKFGGAPPITREDFLSECMKWLKLPEFKTLMSVDINDIDIAPDDPFIVREWKRFNRTLREGVGRIREVKRGVLHETPPTAFMDIFDEANPLFMERKFEKKRWDFIDEKEFGYHFDVNTLVLYFLKLQILERLTAFDKDKGKAVFETASSEVNNVQEAG